MPSAEAVLLVTLAGLVLSVSPGPSMLYVLSRSIGQSRAAGLASAAGLAVGGFVLVIAAALGLAAVFTYFPAAYIVVKIAGGAYLIFLALQMVFTTDDSPDSGRLNAVRQTSLRRIFFQGIVVEVLNPKTLLFFVAFLPQFVDATRGFIWLQMLILGTLVPLTAVPADIITAFTGGTIAKKLAENQLMKRLLNWLGAGFLAYLGLRIFTED